MVDNRQIKDAGARFWDSNPCGGNWDSYRNYSEWIQRTEPYIFRVLDRHNWAGKRVLEVGCGQGTTLNYLPALGAAMTGLDLSIHSLCQARLGAAELGIAERVRLAQADAEHLPFTDATFDAVLSIGVLHHTPDTAGGVQEIHRVLKPGGLAIVMLYRALVPKWWMTQTMRATSRGIDWLARQPHRLADGVRARQQQGQASGTALLELFGVPILKAFTNQQALKMFEGWHSVQITNYQPGFRRLGDVLPVLRPLQSAFTWIDQRTERAWGFYQVIEAIK